MDASELALWVFLVAVAAPSFLCAVSPESAVEWRRRMGWSESLWSGGWFYATPLRARIMGVMLCAVVATLAMIKALG
mgnify:CR=1 FL=1